MANITGQTSTIDRQDSSLSNASDYDYLSLDDIDGDEGLNEDCRTTPLAAFKTSQNVEVSITVRGSGSCVSEHLSHTRLYDINCSLGRRQWQIVRKYHHFQELHRALSFAKAKSRLHHLKSAAAAAATNVTTAINNNVIAEDDQSQKPTPRAGRLSLKFPTTPERFISSTSHIEKRRARLETYLNVALKHERYKRHEATLNFLEISRLSFAKRSGQKYHEGYVEKRSGGRKSLFGLQFIFAGSFGTWNKRWLVLKDSYVCYLRKKNEVADVILFDEELEKVKVGFAETRIHHGLIVSNNTRELSIRCTSYHKSRNWANAFKKVGNECEYVRRHANDSFAPQRTELCKWFVDGATYFDAVAQALDSAQYEIFITDWWMSPEMFLQRPVKIALDPSRLDRILKRKADQGVKVYILLYKEIELAVGGIQSSRCKTHLEKLHENIKVIRHPDHVSTNIYLWSHHEKLVCIDQRIAFLGGLDLCYGRWDDAHHRLVDVGSVQRVTPTSSAAPSRHPSVSSMEQWKGIGSADFARSRRASKTSVKSHKSSFSTLKQLVMGVSTDTCPLNKPDSCSQLEVHADVTNHQFPDTTALDGPVIADANHVNTRRKSASSVDCCSDGLLPSEENSFSCTLRSFSDSAIHNSKIEINDAANNVKQFNSVDKPQTSNGKVLGIKACNGQNLADTTCKAEDNRLNLSPTVTKPMAPEQNFFGNTDKGNEKWEFPTPEKDEQCLPTADSQENPTGIEINEKSNGHLFCPELTREESITNISEDGSMKTPFTDTADMPTALTPPRTATQASLGFAMEDAHKEPATEDPSTILADGGGQVFDDGDGAFACRSPAHKSAHKKPKGKYPVNSLKQADTVDLVPDKRRVSRDVSDKRSWSRIRSNLDKVKSVWKHQQDGGVPKSRSASLITSGSMKGGKMAEQIVDEEWGLEGSTKLWIGKDYANWIVRDLDTARLPYQDHVDRYSTVRMPWHDISCVVFNQAATDVSRHFIQRWNHAKKVKDNTKNNSNYPLLLPRSTQVTYPRLPDFIKENCELVQCQIVRSCPSWASGLHTSENSIQNAYLKLITQAEHYIYIENQFFISAGSDDVENEVGACLAKKILQKHKDHQPFRVFIVLPLLPAFEGQIDPQKSGGSALHSVLHWIKDSLVGHERSLFSRLRNEGLDPNEYVSVCGLRTHGCLNNVPVTELIYAHSKLMIVDDKKCILGSANINDRSLSGDRDSEIAIVIEDKFLFESKMSGKSYQAGNFCYNLRTCLFQEHLGLTGEQLQKLDVTSDEFFKHTWISTAAVNTTVYDKVFRCMPSDGVKTFTDLREYESISPPLASSDVCEANEQLSRVKGYLVLYSLFFLSGESLLNHLGAKESLIPLKFWT